VRYFEWIGAAVYTSDRRSGSMHGKSFLLDSVYAGIDAEHLYGRLDFVGGVPAMDFDLVVNIESWAAEGQRPRRALRLDVKAKSGKLQSWKVSVPPEDQTLASSSRPAGEVGLALVRNFEFKLPLAWLLAAPAASGDGKAAAKASAPVATKLKLRFSLWQNQLPVDALPVEGWIELQLLSEEELMALGY
jgi:hypothetical protein